MDYWWDILNLILIFSIFSISLNLLIGYTGQVSVAHAAFGAIGGYTAAYLSVNYGITFWPSTLIGIFAAGAVGVGVSFPALRLSGEYLVLLTISVSSIVLSIVGAVGALGGAYGIIATTPANLWPIPGGDLLFPGQWVLPLLGFTVLTFAICDRFASSAWGRVLRGIREDEAATQALGRDVLAYKVVVFGVTSALAGLAGVLLFYYNQIVSPNVYGLEVSLKIFAMTIFGGLGNLLGSVLGAAIVQLLQPLLENVVQLDPGNAFLVQLVVYGLGLVILIRVRPLGLLPEGLSLRRFFRQPQMGTTMVEGEPYPSTVTHSKSGGPLLVVRGLRKSFGGIDACRDLNMELEEGKVVALIGPNGAGKTTVFNLLTGVIKPDQGSVLLRGEEIKGSSPNVIARKGMVRSFQNVRTFARMSALENVMLAVRQPTLDWWRWPGRLRGGENLFDLFLRPSVTSDVERETRKRAMQWLTLVGLADVADVPAGSLAFGEQKLLAFARLLATDADVFLLDEAASGIDGMWVDKVLDIVAFMRAQGKTVCIVEHSLHVVEKLADKVFFMELGHITARGTIAELKADPRLAEVYFGTV